MECIGGLRERERARFEKERVHDVVCTDNLPMCLLFRSSLFDYPHLGGSQAKTVSTALYVEVINRAYDMNQADDSLKFLFSDGLVFDDQSQAGYF